MGPSLHLRCIYEILCNHQIQKTPTYHFLFIGNKVCCLDIDQITLTVRIVCSNCCRFENNFLAQSGNWWCLVILLPYFAMEEEENDTIDSVAESNFSQFLRRGRGVWQKGPNTALDLAPHNSWIVLINSTQTFLHAEVLKVAARHLVEVNKNINQDYSQDQGCPCDRVRVCFRASLLCLI